MGIFETNAQRATNVRQDELYAIYGPPGSGKTVLASSFPGTKEKPQLYVDIVEGGTDSIPVHRRDSIVVVRCDTFEQVDEVFSDVLNGQTTLSNGKVIKLDFSSIVIDSATQLEFLMKEYLKNGSGKKTMNLNLWGQLKNNSEVFYNLMKNLNSKLGIPVVVIAHVKEMKDDENPSFNKLIPSLMTSASHSLCAKASHVWYTDIRKVTTVDPSTQTTVDHLQYVTVIDSHPYLNTKCRKPPKLQIPGEFVDLTYDTFKIEVLNKIK